ncbi:MAG: hypothetical protein HeimC2_37980 [Candidatus Heimdallarchaeota archaeon LC_2]|nr:MAG: hypothetical protein HeimC2_37980 [Candidatus Heimdallarchaeota archaeon LC_2]
MFENLEAVVRAERIRLEENQKWLTSFFELSKGLIDLVEPWKEKELIQKMPKRIPNITKIAAVDGGVQSEAMTGFDLIVYRSAGVVFHGIGSKVEAKYIPSVDPEPLIFFNPSLPSRFDFAKLATLLRLKSEYELAKQIIIDEKPTILFIDGKVSPIHSDLIEFTEQSPVIKDAQNELKLVYRDLIKEALENQVLLCGVVKDSRSTEVTSTLLNQMSSYIKNKNLDGSKLRGWRKTLTNLLDEYFGLGFLPVQYRTAWLRSETPSWINFGSRPEIWTCLAKPLVDDSAIRLEVLYMDQFVEFEKLIEIALGAYNYLCNHGLPIAIPTIIMDADDRAKLSQLHLETIIDQISITLGIPKDHLRKRRNYHTLYE